MAWTSASRGTLLLLAAAGPALLAGPVVGRAPAQEAPAQEAPASLERARELRANGRYGRAVEVLRRYLAVHPDQAEVRWYLAETLYWAERPAAARDQLRRALRRNPGMEGARDLWWELQSILAPRFTLALAYEDDDQPLTSLGSESTATVPVGSTLELVGDAAYRRLEAAAEDARVLAGRLGLALEPPASPIRAEFRLGGTRGPEGRGGWIGAGGLEVELPGGLALRGTGRRWSDRNTATSLDTLLLVESLSATLSRSDPTGWSGEVGGSVDRYPGGNTVRAYHAWILAPLLTSGADAFRVGYGFSYHDAEATTFAPRAAGPGEGAGRSDGRYDPYYTPEEVRIHDAVAAARLSLPSGVVLSADGSVGLHAVEQAPGGGPGGITFSEREFRPWRLRGRLSADLTPALGFRGTASYRKDAFFRIFRVSGALTYRFTEAPPGR